MVIYFEGVDGVGKTTIMKAVARALIANNEHRFVLTKEPGGPGALWSEWNEPEDLKSYFGQAYDAGKLVRDLCVNHPNIPQLAKRALYKADNLCNWVGVSQPALAEDKLVLSDRGWISDLVYGAVLLNMDAHSLYQFNTALVPSLPDVTYVVCYTCTTETREARLAVNVRDEMDKLGSGVRDKLAAAYITLIPQYLNAYQYTFITSEQSIDEAVKATLEFIYGLLP